MWNQPVLMKCARVTLGKTVTVRVIEQVGEEEIQGEKYER